MQKINAQRAILGGLVAGLVINVIEGVMHGVVLAKADADVMTSLNRSPSGSGGQIAALNAWGFALGIVTILLYASIRPRFGAGPKTAVRAGLFVWAGASALGAAVPLITGIYRVDITVINVGYELAMLCVAAIAGAAVYKEE